MVGFVPGQGAIEDESLSNGEIPLEPAFHDRYERMEDPIAVKRCLYSN